MQGQALLAATSFGLELNSDDRIKIICMRSETVNAALPPRVSQKESRSTSSRGKIEQNFLPIYPGAVAKLVDRTSPTEIRKLCLRDLLATILATLSVRQQRLHIGERLNGR